MVEIRGIVKTFGMVKINGVIETATRSKIRIIGVKWMKLHNNQLSIKLKNLKY